MKIIFKIVNGLKSATFQNFRLYMNFEEMYKLRENPKIRAKKCKNLKLRDLDLSLSPSEAAQSLTFSP